MTNKMDAKIRKDWYTALQNVKYGAELSSKIDFGFTDQDLMVLLCLHKGNLFRQKIEDLLEDCNFHTECGLLSDGEYDECLEVIIANATMSPLVRWMVTV